MNILKKYFALFGLVFSISGKAQSSYQLDLGKTTSLQSMGIGLAQSLRPRIQLLQGTVSVRPVRTLSFLFEYQQSLPDRLLNFGWGSRAMFSFYRGWWDLSQAVSYYQPSVSTYALDKFDQAELFLFLRQQKIIFQRKEFSGRIGWQAGPAFSFNSHLNRLEGLVETRRDSGAAFQVCSVLQEKRQPLWLPYLRASVGIDFVFKSGDHTFITLTPFFDLAAFYRDQLSFSTLPADPQFASLGKFKWNRNQIGFKCSVSSDKLRR